MKLGKYTGALFSRSAKLGDKPGSVEKPLKSGAPRPDGRNTKRAKTDKRMAAAAAELAKVWR